METKPTNLGASLGLDYFINDSLWVSANGTKSFQYLQVGQDWQWHSVMIRMQLSLGVRV